MRRAEDVLNVIRDRGERGLPLEDVYRQLYNPTLYLRAYGRIYRNNGAMTEGTTEETVDGMCLAKIQRITNDLRNERYAWTPVRRTYIPKKNGNKRPLGIPTWSDKLLQEVMRSILEAYFEPQFSDHSHGFRPMRGCHTALWKIGHAWRGTKWFIEGDIKGCFDNIDHEILLSILSEKIQDNRFIRLIANLLKAGYMECWDYKPTLSGTPQGGIISPILSNTYLDRLDKFVEQTLLPEYNCGTKRKEDPQYRKMADRARYLKRTGRVEEAKRLEKQYQRMPVGDPNDPEYRRLRYIRYADDFLLGFVGPKAEAETIKEKLRAFLQEKLHLELSVDKTLITHATTDAARFLGYEIVSHQCDTKHDVHGRRIINGGIGLRLPADVVEAKCALYKKGNQPVHRSELVNDSDFSIVDQYQAEYRGYVQYYLLAQNVDWMDKVQWTMETSLLKTLACKHKTSVASVITKYRNTVQTDHGPRKCIQVTIERENKKPLVTYFGGIPLRRRKEAILVDQQTHRFAPKRTEIEKRLLASECEICKATQNVEVHHVRKLADLRAPGRKEKPVWMQIMSARKRKTLVLCQACHDDLHAGRPLNYVTE